MSQNSRSQGSKLSKAGRHRAGRHRAGRHWAGRHWAGGATGGPHARRLLLEPLEARLLLSTADGDQLGDLSATYDPVSQLLVVQGTGQSDLVAVWADAEATVQVESPPGTPITICDPLGNPVALTLQEVDSVRIDLLGGDDRLSVGQPMTDGDSDVDTVATVDTTPFSVRQIDIELGAGEDAVVTDFAAASFANDIRTSVNIIVAGGEGSDTLTVLTPSLDGVGPLRPAVPLRVRFDSGPGEADAVEILTTDRDDDVTVVGLIGDDVPDGRQFQVEVTERGMSAPAAELSIVTVTRVAIDTGAGDDTLVVDFSAAVFGSSYPEAIDVLVAGGEGSDTLTVLTPAPQNVDPQRREAPLAVQFDSGPGEADAMHVNTTTADEQITVVGSVDDDVPGGRRFQIDVTDRRTGELTAVMGPFTVTHVGIDAGGGDDVVEIQAFTNDVQFDAFSDMHYDVNLGEGDNLLALDGKGNQIAVNVQAGAGADVAIVRVKPVPASPAGMVPGKLTAKFDLGGGNDAAQVVALAEEGDAESFFDLDAEINLGGGDNTLALDGKGNDMAVKVRAGRGADEVIVRVKPVPASPAGMAPGRLTAEIDLDGGNDVVELVASGDDSQLDSLFDIRVDMDLGEGDNVLALDGKGNDVAMAVRTGRGQDVLSIDVSAVESIESQVVTGPGADTIHGAYSLGNLQVDGLPAAASARSQPASRIQVAAGRGDDQVALQLAGMLNAPMAVRVMGHRGRDNVSMEAGQLNIGPDGALFVGLHGGRGRDRIQFSNQTPDGDAVPPEVAGRLRVTLTGGRGNDTVSALLGCDVTDTGYLSAVILGGPGRDLLTLLAADVAGRWMVLGGPGYDRCLVSDNVWVRQCEGLIGNIETIDRLWERFF